MKSYNIRNWFHFLKSTPVHPQWLIFRRQKKFMEQVGNVASGLVLDIGSGRQNIRPFLHPTCQYLPLDYYDTAVNWYAFLPKVFADAQSLPIKNESIDTVLILDVLEHLPRPENCLAEIYRVLKPGMNVIVQVPFLYPIHDQPLDFQRWTQHGLNKLMAKHNFTISQIDYDGTPLETAILLLNLALSKTILNFIRDKKPLALFGFLLPLILLVNHLIVICSQFFTPQDFFMPLGYQLILTKGHNKPSPRENAQVKQ